MRFEHTGSLPVLALEPYEEATQNLWESQGHLKKGESPDHLLDMDSFMILPLNFGPIPAYERKRLWEDEKYYIETDFMGGTVKRKKESPSIYYGFIDHPVKNMDDWNEYKKRFTACPERLPAALSNDADKYNKSENPVGIHLFPFFFRLGFYAMGMERFMETFYLESELIHEMFGYWSDFTLDMLRMALESVKPDFVTLTEDLAYKGATHVSPSMYEKFWLPYQNKVIKLLQNYDIEVISLWSAGKIDGILDTVIKNGVNCTWPLERASGVDPTALRLKYKKNLLMAGGIPVKALIDGKEAIERAICEITPIVAQGGFIPALDDMVSPDIPFENYKFFIGRLREIRQ